MARVALANSYHGTINKQPPTRQVSSASSSDVQTLILSDLETSRSGWMGKGNTSPKVGRSRSVTGWVQQAKKPAGGLGSRATFTYL